MILAKKLKLRFISSYRLESRHKFIVKVGKSSKIHVGGRSSLFSLFIITIFLFEKVVANEISYSYRVFEVINFACSLSIYSYALSSIYKQPCMHVATFSLMQPLSYSYIASY